MAAAPLSIIRTLSTVPLGGKAVTVAYGPIIGGFLVNPALASDQGIHSAETLYVDIINPAALDETATTAAIQPGQFYQFPSDLQTDVSVNAATSGHRFSIVLFQAPINPNPQPQPGTFPPSGPTTLSAIIPSYLYQEYDDDDDLQGFVAAWNGLAQVYASWFADIGLPIYTGSAIYGALLDWVAQGIYGIERPALSSGRSRSLGPVNTYGPNQLPLNHIKRIGPNNVTVTSDDVFKRIITWNFYKGDGNRFSIEWLKRRVMRFLIGTNGTAPNIDNTYPISVTFDPSGVITIRITVGTRTVLGGCFPNRMGPNSRHPPNSLITQYNSPPNPYPLETVLQEAIESGVLTLPFQFTYVVIV